MEHVTADTGRFVVAVVVSFFVLFCLAFVFWGVYLAAPCRLWDLSSPTRDHPTTSAVKAQSPNRWTAREFPVVAVLIGSI